MRCHRRTKVVQYIYIYINIYLIKPDKMILSKTHSLHSGLIEFPNLLIRSILLGTLAFFR